MDTTRIRPRIDIPDPRVEPTISIVRAGQLLGLSRDGAYQSANAGLLPTIQITPSRRRVPTARLLALLGLQPENAA